jgi:hypothetical protein
LPKDGVYVVADFVSGLAPVPEFAQQAVIVGVGVADVGQYGQAHGLGVEVSRSRGSADASAGTLAGVGGDLGGFGRGAVGVRGLDGGDEGRNEGLVGCVTSEGGANALAHTDIGICLALLLRLRQCIWLDQDTLALVALAGARPLHDHGLQRGVPPGAARQRGIAARQKLEFGQVSARQTQDTVAFAAQEAASAQLFMALAARRVAAHAEDDDVAVLRIGRG